MDGAPDADIALEHAREAILQLEHEASVETTLTPTSAEDFPFSTLRREGQAAEDAQTLAALKREIGVRGEIPTSSAGEIGPHSSH